mmetsp:Transcript_33469/g.82896  ORF Transcript_33469/g.82896 Transcript_33469/m.82896 type:complete len:217 (+) Transcript_33469:80-730(+)
MSCRDNSSHHISPQPRETRSNKARVPRRAHARTSIHPSIHSSVGAGLLQCIQYRRQTPETLRQPRQRHERHLQTVKSEQRPLPYVPLQHTRIAQRQGRPIGSRRHLHGVNSFVVAVVLCIVASGGVMVSNGRDLGVSLTEMGQDQVPTAGALGDLEGFVECAVELLDGLGAQTILKRGFVYQQVTVLREKGHRVAWPRVARVDHVRQPIHRHTNGE